MAASNTLQIVIDARDNATKELNKLQSSLQKVSGKFSTEFGLMSKAASAAGYAIAGAGAALAAAGVFAVRSAADYEQNRIAFESMLGSADKARDLLKKVSDFAAKTPFELPQVVEGSKRLLAYNISAEKIIPTFKMLGDIASGVGTDKMPQLVTAFGQVAAKGKLMGQELLQFTEAGVGLGGELQKMLGIGRDELEKMISAGQIGFPQVEEALRRMTAEGGLFFDGMSRQSQTFNGILSNLTDNFGKMAREVIGINEQGDIREGSVFALMKSSAEKLLAWIDAHKEEIAAKMQEWIDKVMVSGKAWLDQMGGPEGLAKKLNDIWDAITNKVIPALVSATKFITEHGDTILKAIVAYEGLKIISTFPAMFTALSAAVKVLSVGFGLLTGAAAPWLLAGAAIVGLVAGIIWLVKNWDKMKDGAKIVADAIAGFFGSMADRIKGAFNTAVSWVFDKINVLIRAYNKVADKLDAKKISELSYSARATGGSVMMGKPYLVGENGPEVFVPSGSGRIENSMSATNNRTINVNINLSGAIVGDKAALIREIQYAISRSNEVARLGIA